MKQETEGNHSNNGTEIKKKHSKKSLFIKTFFISILVFSAIAAGALYLAIKYAKPPAVPAYAEELSPPEITTPPDNDDNNGNGVYVSEGFMTSGRKEEFYTFLIIGLDAGVQTDTIIVCSYDGKNDEAHLVSIPRDSLVNVKRTTKKINAAYSAGYNNGGGRDGGVAQLRSELRSILGFAPDFYVIVNLNAFTRIVDAVGGVEVNVPFDMIYNDPEQNLHINISKGVKTLNGAEALKFARYRTGIKGVSPTISDYQRIENQQQVIRAVADKLLRPANILKIPEFIDIFNTNVTHNIKTEDMLWFANEFRNLKSLDILQTHTLPTKDSVMFNLSYEILDEEGILELVNRTLNPYKKDIEAKDLDIITKIE